MTFPPSSAQPDLAVVIVTWNNAAVIRAALSSLLDDLQDSGLRNEVWVVDSASQDQTAEIVRHEFPTVHLVVKNTNLGFAAANNLAMRELGFGGAVDASQTPAAVFLLNPDTVTHPGATRRLYDALMARPEVGVVGARLTFADGGFQHSAFRFPGLRQIWAELLPTPGRLLDGSFNGRYPRAYFAAAEAFEVDFTLGATMMLRREVIQRSGIFDEAFFLYCEEVDWAWRIRKLGWQILCVPAAHVTHIGGGSTSQARPDSLIHLWKSRLLLYEKHYPNWKRQLARRLVILGMWRKMRNLDALDTELRAACQKVIEMAKA
ncbi:MAG: glycosyltransferase family 2 protein [Chloroflexi bacterium]|nr:glycosyltransferase family 2 protein [Chloroflexota bacterium]